MNELACCTPITIHEPLPFINNAQIMHNKMHNKQEEWAIALSWPLSRPLSPPSKHSQNQTEGANHYPASDPSATSAPDSDATDSLGTAASGNSMAPRLRSAKKLM